MRAWRSATLCAIVAVLWIGTGPAIAQTTGSACDSGTTAAAYDCAMAQVGRREFAAAVRTLEPIVARAPRDLKALNLLGIALTGAGQPEAANARFRAALAIDPRFVPARKNLAINELALGSVDAARQHFETVLAQAPDDEIAHLHLAEIQFQRKQWRGALPHYEKGRVRLAQHPPWLLHYASALLADGRKADAIALLDALPADDGASWFEAGVMLGKHGAHIEAARAFGEARTRGYADAFAAAYNQTLMLIDGGDPAGAIGVAEPLLARGDGQGGTPLGAVRGTDRGALVQGHQRAELLSLVARAYAKTHRIKEAYDALREATRIEPTVAEHYIDLTMLCLDHENYDLGLEIVDVGLKHRPDSSMLYLQRGVVLAMKGSVEQAEPEFARASKAAPDSPAPYVALAMVWMLKGQTPKAVDVLRTRTRTGKPQAVLFYALGMALLRSGAAPDDAAGNEATDAFRTAVRLEPTFPQAQAELGKLLLKRGDVPGAIAHLEKATTLDPESSGPAYVLAQAYRRAGQMDRARDLLARVSRINAQERGDDPDGDMRRVVVRIVRESATADAAATAGAAVSEGAGAAGDAATRRGQAQEHLRRAVMVRGNVREAISEYQEALRLAPDLVPARYGLGTVCAAAGDLDGAIAHLRAAVDAGPVPAEARYQLGVALWNRFQRAAGGGGRRKSDLDDAAVQLAAAVQQQPQEPQLQLVLGQLLAEQQHFAKAVEHLTRAAALAPNDADYAYNLGLGLRLAGDLDGAERQFRAALAHKADHALARRSLGLVLRQKDNAAAAATELRRAVELLPDDAQGHHLLGGTLLRLGDAAGAVTELRRAIQLDPALVEAHVLLAQALAKQGAAEDARREQAEVQRLNTEKADFGRTLVALDASVEALKQGDGTRAIAQAREAVTLSPGFAEAHFQLGLALAFAAAPDADASLRRAIALDATHARAHIARARLLDARGDAVGARDARDRAATLAPCSEHRASSTEHPNRDAPVYRNVR